MAPSLRIEKLLRIDNVEIFDSGSQPLNRFLHRHALQSQQSNASQTYLAKAGDDVIGYYSLVVGEIGYEAASERLAKSLARHPIPVMILARLAIAMTWHGRGVGAGLLKDAMLRTLHAADIAGIRALIVHAKDDAAKSFYEHFDFLPSPTDPMHLYLLLKDIKAASR